MVAFSCTDSRRCCPQGNGLPRRRAETCKARQSDSFENTDREHRLRDHQCSNGNRFSVSFAIALFTAHCLPAPGICLRLSPERSITLMLYSMGAACPPAGRHTWETCFEPSCDGCAGLRRINAETELLNTQLHEVRVGVCAWCACAAACDRTCQRLWGLSLSLAPCSDCPSGIAPCPFVVAEQGAEGDKKAGRGKR